MIIILINRDLILIKHIIFKNFNFNISTLIKIFIFK